MVTITNSNSGGSKLFLTEDGLYEVLMQSRKPIAKQFKKEVKKILKGLRKGELSLQKTRKEELILGLYNSNGGQEAVMISKELVAIEVEEATKPLIDTIDILKPAADYTNNVLNPGNAIKLLTVTDISKDLGMSAQALNLKLHKLGVQYKRGGYWKFYSKYDYLIPEYADYVIDEYGQFLKWTEKGRQWIIEFLEKNDKKED